MQANQISVIDFFQELPDPRQQAKILYPLNEIILVTLCAIICGANSYVEIEEFGNAKIDFLRRFFPFEHGIPSHDTFGLVFSNIDSKKFNEIFILWVQSLQNSIPELIAIDGKTVRRSMDNGKKPIHIISAWASEQNIVLGQLKTNKKSNEITSIPELLSMLIIKGAIVSIDAMGCQKSILEDIIQSKANYVISLKKNQPSLYSDVEILFNAATSRTIPLNIEEYVTHDGGHGRIETRNYSIMGAIDLLPTASDWPGLKSIGKVTSIREQAGKTTEEVRYFISSLPPDVNRFSKVVRHHWTIENKLHWVLDIAFREDESRIRKGHGAANFVTLRHITQNMLRALPGKKSMRVRRKRAGWDDLFLMQALGANTN